MYNHFVTHHCKKAIINITLKIYMTTKCKQKYNIKYKYQHKAMLSNDDSAFFKIEFNSL